LVQKNDRSLFDWKKVIKCASITFDGGCAQYCLPYHKGDPFYRGSDVIMTTQDVTNPVSLLHDLNSNSLQFLIIILAVIPHAQVMPPSWLLWAFWSLSFKLLEDGPWRLGKFIFERIPQ
jgi:hypothetical protein